jgi:PAS domain-containing protein
LFFSLVHPDDHVAIRAAVAAAIDRRQPYLIDHRIVWRSGEVRHVREAGRVDTDESTGRPLKLIGTVHDITDERRAAEALRQTETQWHEADRRRAAIVHGMSEACFAVDAQWGLIFINDRGEALLRTARAEMLGRSFWTVFAKLVGTALEEPFRRAMADRRPEKFEMFSPLAGRWLDVRIFPSGDGLAAFVLDIDERKQGEARIQSQLAELQRWHAVTQGREERILTLKREVNQLLAAAGQAPRYGVGGP